MPGFMRRYLLVLMMVLLPLQWSWAAAASVCAHESGKAHHLGHHEYKHGAGSLTGKSDTNKSDGASLGSHPDCQVCHGVGVACVKLADDNPPAWVGASTLPEYERYLPDPPVDAFLRPPLHLVA